MVVNDALQPEIAEAVSSLMYAGYLMGNDIPELKNLLDLFTLKYNKKTTEEIIAEWEVHFDEKYLGKCYVGHFFERSMHDGAIAIRGRTHESLLSKLWEEEKKE